MTVKSLAIHRHCAPKSRLDFAFARFMHPAPEGKSIKPDRARPQKLSDEIAQIFSEQRSRQSARLKFSTHPPTRRLLDSPLSTPRTKRYAGARPPSRPASHSR